MGIVVQILGRGRRPQHTVTLEQSSISIGRGFSNDVIIDDPYVCAHHAKVELMDDGRFIIHDLECINGVMDSGHHRVDQSSEFKSGQIFILGNTRIRLFSMDHEVAPAIRLTFVDGLIRKLERPSNTLLLAIVLGLLIGLRGYLQSTEEFKLSLHFNAILGLALIVLSWALLWSIIARLGKHDSRFQSQLIITMAFLMLSMFAAAALSFFDFNISNYTLQQIVLLFISGCLLFGLLWFNLYIALQQSPRRRFLVSASLTALLIGINIAYLTLNQSEFERAPAYSSTLLPPAYRVSQSTALEEFYREAEGVFTKIDISTSEDK